MISAIQLLIDARCGRLTWLCCLTADQFIEVRDLFDGMSDTDLRTMHETICACAVVASPQNGGAGGTTPTDTMDCSKIFEETMCDNEAVLAVAIAAKEAIDLVLLGAVAVPLPQAKVVVPALYALANVLEGWTYACALEGITHETLHGICNAVTAVRDSYNSWGLLAMPLKPVEWLLESSGFAEFVNMCCDDAAVQAAQIPRGAQLEHAEVEYKKRQNGAAATNGNGAVENNMSGMPNPAVS
jgi:hypothetical protein